MTRPNASDASPKLARIPTHLATKLDKHLLAYATAASAAGVALLASTQSAEAKIVYTQANVTIPVNGGLISFDLNNDGVPDFGFYLSVYSGGRRHPEGFFAAGLSIIPANAANQVWAVESKGAECAAALPSGVKVGPTSPFKPNALAMWEVAGDYTSPGSEKCPWQAKHRGAFLGLKFVINGLTHYGWAHVTQGSTTVLNGFAYETVPNQPIFTGKTSGPVSIAGLGPTPVPLSQPATLGLLAQGSRGLAIWRRPEEQES